MPIFNGISVTIRVDGDDVPEYRVERDAERKKVSCWVSSQVDKEFDVILNSGTRARGPWAADVRADGVLTSCPVFLQDQSSNVGYYQKSSTVKRPFSFSKLDLVDDDALLHACQDTHIGEIEISCYTVEITDTYYRPDYDTSFADKSKLHEKSKKGVAEHVGFQKEISENPCKFFNARNLEHLGTFVFRYRPLAFLQAKGIAPSEQQTISEAGGTRDKQTGNAVGDDDTEIRALEAQLAQARARLKRKRVEDGSTRQKKVKTEPQPASVPGEVIDLT